MPKLFRIGGYSIYFWVNEGDPLEPVHVHVSKGSASRNSTKIWITSKGKTLLCNNNSKIPQNDLKNILRQIEVRAEKILQRWQETFGEIAFYV